MVSEFEKSFNNIRDIKTYRKNPKKNTFSFFTMPSYVEGVLVCEYETLTDGQKISKFGSLGPWMVTSHFRKWFETGVGFATILD